MYWSLAVTFAFGIICGTSLRLPGFVVLSVVYIACLFVGWGSLSDHPLLALLAAAVVIEAGYGAGLILRALVTSGLSRKRGASQPSRWRVFRSTFRTRPR
jgi:hypothetical protein